MSAELIQFMTIQMLAVMSPGPDFAIVSRNALNSGKGAGLATSLGIATAVFVHVLYTALGFSQVVLNNPGILLPVKVCGFIYLSFLGIKLLLSKKFNAKSKIQSKDLSLVKAFSQGFITNLLNPKCMLFFLSLFSVALDPHHTDQLKILVTFIFVSTLGWFSFVSIFLSRPKSRELYLRKQVTFDRMIGIFLMVLSFKLLID